MSWNVPGPQLDPIVRLPTVLAMPSAWVAVAPLVTSKVATLSPVSVVPWNTAPLARDAIEKS